MVQVSEKTILPQVADIDSEITRVDTKQGVKLAGHKHITTKSYKIWHCDYKNTAIRIPILNTAKILSPNKKAAR